MKNVTGAEPEDIKLSPKNCIKRRTRKLEGLLRKIKEIISVPLLHKQRMQQLMEIRKTSITQQIKHGNTLVSTAKYKTKKGTPWQGRMNRYNDGLITLLKYSVYHYLRKHQILLRHFPNWKWIVKDNLKRKSLRLLWNWSQEKQQAR